VQGVSSYKNFKPGAFSGPERPTGARPKKNKMKGNIMNKNAIVYTRVSTEEQAEKGYSLESQIKACRKYALDNGMNIVAEIKDDYTGSTLDRPGFNELKSLLVRKEANAIIVTEDDRLSRNAANTLAIYEEWEEAGIELHYCDKGRVSFGEESILINGVPILVA